MANFRKKKGSTETAEMTFIDHLDALRMHIIRSVLVIFITSIVIFIYRNWVFDNIITGPINPNFITYRALYKISHWLGMGDGLTLPPVQVNMQTTSFGGQFLGSITLAFTMGAIVSAPYVFWELWRFIKPALTPKELKNTRFAIFWVSFFFFLGAAFGFFLLGPYTFNFLANFKLGTLSMLETRPTLTDYLENLTNIILGCGLAFELPVVTFVLTRIGLLTPMFMRRSRRYAIVILLTIAAFITPSPDWMSMMIVFVPLMSLYELSILVAAKVYKDEQKKEKEEWG